MSGLTKEEMRRDDVQFALVRASIWLRDNVKTLIAIGVVIVVLGAAYAVYLGFSQGAAARAENALQEALAVYQAPIDPLLAQAEGDSPVFATVADRRAAARVALEDVVESHGGRPGGQLANVFLGEIAAAEGDLEGARSRWSSFLSSGGDDAVAASVQMSLFELDRNAGKIDEVIAELEGLLSGPGGRLPEDVVLRELGLSYAQAGRVDEAKESYQRLMDEYPRSAFSRDASDFLREHEDTEAGAG